MQITLNGAPRELPAPLTVAGLLDRLELAGRRVAVEVNEELVPRSQHPGRLLEEGDRVEVVQAIGGG